MNETEVKAQAEAHWEWLESWLHKCIVDAFVHGRKHGQEEVDMPLDWEKEVKDAQNLES